MAEPEPDPSRTPRPREPGRTRAASGGARPLGPPRGPRPGREEAPPVSPPPTRGPGGERPARCRAEPSGLLGCYRCRYLGTARACCQLVEVLLTMLILICSSVSYSSTGGYTGIPSLGGIYYYQYGGAYSGFDGAEGEKAQQLDAQFYQLKLPVARAAMAVGGALMAFSCLLVLVGVLRLPWRFPAWLLLECILDIVIALGFLPALYLYFHQLSDTYDSPVCKEREHLYQSKGYQGFSCSLHGAEIAAGLFSCIAIVAFLVSAGLAVRGYKTVHQLREKPVQMSEFEGACAHPHYPSSSSLALAASLDTKQGQHHLPCLRTLHLHCHNPNTGQWPQQAPLAREHNYSWSKATLL